MKTSPRLVVAVLYLSCCSSVLLIAAQTTPGPTPGQVTTLIAQLDHDDFDKREEAMERLVDIGEPASGDRRLGTEINGA